MHVRDSGILCSSCRPNSETVGSISLVLDASLPERASDDWGKSLPHQVWTVLHDKKGAEFAPLMVRYGRIALTGHMSLSVFPRHSWTPWRKGSVLDCFMVIWTMDGVLLLLSAISISVAQDHKLLEKGQWILHTLRNHKRLCNMLPLWMYKTFPNEVAQKH